VRDGAKGDNLNPFIDSSIHAEKTKSPGKAEKGKQEIVEKV
jgi:hypothetical protein